MWRNRGKSDLGVKEQMEKEPRWEETEIIKVSVQQLNLNTHTKQTQPNNIRKPTMNTQIIQAQSWYTTTSHNTQPTHDVFSLVSIQLMFVRSSYLILDQVISCSIHLSFVGSINSVNYPGPGLVEKPICWTPINGSCDFQGFCLLYSIGFVVLNSFRHHEQHCAVGFISVFVSNVMFIISGSVT